MNERIHQIAEQVYGSAATAQEIKFAELIVRECLEIVKLNAELYPRGGDHKSQMAVCEEYNRTFKNIKKRFGVE
jgi:hypothetical protein